MISLARRLSDHLAQREEVVASFRLAHFRLASFILSDAVEYATDSAEPEWQQLLSWASVFAQSDIDVHVELAMVASISALLTANTTANEARQAATFILESCSNMPTIELARERGLVGEDYANQHVSVLLGRHQRRLRHFIFDDYKRVALPVTEFQERIWDALAKRGDTAFSAPTSAGKSFVLVRWLAQSLLDSQSNSVMAYIVPSRALISQVRNNLADMFSEYGITPRIITLPTLYRHSTDRGTILVMTQERIERLFSVTSDLSLQALVIDEAHKLGEGARGVVLQRVIDETLARSRMCKVVLAAPHAKNTEVLLPRSSASVSLEAPPVVISDSRPTVLQNLLWITPIPRRVSRWSVTLVHDDQLGVIGEFQLGSRVTGKKRQLASLAHHLCGVEGGNIVFTNGAAEAEEVALHISGLIELSGGLSDIHKDVTDLAKLVKDTIHPSYPLASTLQYGIGIHYGDMPEIARREQERLFDEGKLSFLVCTSTLLEGVNLPCKNLFIWGPSQGRKNRMTEHAFWNLAGRAGRWGREFAGNIFCVDVHDIKQWPNGPPTRRYAQNVSHSGAQLLDKINQFKDFALSTDPLQDSIKKENRYFEQVLGELVGTFLDGRNISQVGWAQWGNPEQLKMLNDIVGAVVCKLTAPVDVLKRHRGINPILVSMFYDYLKSLDAGEAETLLPMTLATPDAFLMLSDNMKLCDRFLGSDFGTDSQIHLKAGITIGWIRGLPLGQIINDRIRYTSKSPNFKITREIRSVIEIINKNARYLIPKYLSCYSDCVASWFNEIGRADLVEEVADIRDMLETGVADRTMIALVGLGLSRTAAVEIAQRIPDSEFSVDDAIKWLQGRNLEVYGISPVIIREVSRVLDATQFL